jgi:ribulose-5-phosphate 4-epimerase/fuculose-1-phosphate aldolase
MHKCNNTIVSQIDKLTNDIKPLIYEYAMYLGKINKLVKYNICPFFVTTKGGSLRTTKKEIINFLVDKVEDDEHMIESNSYQIIQGR